MKLVATKFVSKLLNFEQEQRRGENAPETLNAANDHKELPKRIVKQKDIFMDMTRTHGRVLWHFVIVYKQPMPLYLVWEHIL